MAFKALKRFNSFNWEDPLNLSRRFTEEENMIWKAARDYAQSSLLPRIVKAYNTESVDTQIMKELGQQGFLGCTHKEYGLPGISQVAYGLISREIEGVDSAYRSAYSVQNCLVIHPIMSFAPKPLKDRLIPGLTSGELVGCFGLTEPNHGSNPSGMETHFKKVGAKYILNGSKTWISHSPIADVFIIWAKNENKEIEGLVLEKGMPGLSAPKIEGKLSLRASVTGMIMMDNVEVPEGNKLEVKGLKGPMSCLNQARFGIAWGTLGAAESCYRIARNYTLERKQFDKPIAQNQLIQKKLADMATELALGFSAVYEVSRLKEEKKLVPEMISLIKRNSCLKALTIARDARDMLGANGIVDEYHVMRHMINLETVNTYEGTADIHALVLGKAITGLQSFK
jgi:glutaryl-CoA dehydrogenase